MFGVKDPIPPGLRTSVVYKFLCAGRNACYVGETSRHLSTRVREHVVSDKTSHIFKYLHNVALYVLISVLIASLVKLPQLSNLKSKKLSTCNGGNLHLIINSIMLM